MEQWNIWFDRDLWIAIGIVVVATAAIYTVLRALVGIVHKRLTTWSKGQDGNWQHFVAVVIGRTNRTLLLAFSLLLALRLPDLPGSWQAALSHTWFVALALQIALWVDTGVRLWSRSLVVGKHGGSYNPVMTTIISIMVLIVVWSVMLLSILANLGVDITALVASLGVGGIAVALAVQTVLSDVFASLSIGVDKPFEIGDFVVFGEVAGSIEHIGLKTTRIRSLSGEQVVCANADLLRQIVHNYKRMDTRRIVFKFGISYDTPSDKVRQVSERVGEIIRATPKTQFDRAHFLGFDESQLTFEVVYIVQSSDYNQYMDIQQEINLQLLDALRELDVRFALPRRDLRLVGERMPTLKVAGLPQQAEPEADDQDQRLPRFS
ncbi:MULTISPECIES: mechanosensitive ion channel family protein [unclassified Pseudomonas]|jgi:small-conductance mechanosensitive channel|uniref:mechanosensitive ion channel family protein n=1 Tax=unclassified Pseudomonas TaxID=196821 RepID=UPI000DAC7BAC|nr:MULTISPECIES: mechanosensitive ion channel family protein [unclassified Pseudomonas]MBD9656261.1 mechanosensitive ion channel family protein [Pseudomonas sp. PDM12]PZW46439.1 small-conductance mechanosensitive channel [Pseudomonas sp. URMO17WK12:I2]